MNDGTAVEESEFLRNSCSFWDETSGVMLERSGNMYESGVGVMISI